MRTKFLLIFCLAAGLAALPVRAQDAAIPEAPKPTTPTAQKPAEPQPDPLEFSDADAEEDEDSSSALQDDVEQEQTVTHPKPNEGQPSVAAPGSNVPRHGVPVPPSNGNPFPSGPTIDKQQKLWVRVFTKLGSDRGVIHDGRSNDPMYEELDLTDLKPKEQKQFIKHRLGEVAAYLRDAADAMEQKKDLDEQTKRLVSQLPPNLSPDDIREYSRNLRFQRGLSDRFRGGVVRSGSFDAEIRRTLAEFDVPEDLVNLPHVESSYNNATRSHAGAIGIWQFTRGTGKLFMTVGNEVDERLDPLIAARAAAKFLRQNYERLGTWPLAITAYNHGPQSLEKIVGRMGTTDLNYLIDHYDGPLFKFASKNFYAEFLAARHVATNYATYFGDVERNTPFIFKRVDLPFFMDFERAAQLLGINKTTLADLNPSLRQPVLTGTRYIPKGYRLRIPVKHAPELFLANVPADARKSQQKAITEIRVARGDTLYSIGRRYNVPWMSIAAANNLSPRARLMPGQRLIMPGRSGASTVAVADTGSDTAPTTPAASATPVAVTSVVAAAPAEPKAIANASAPRKPVELPALQAAVTTSSSGSDPNLAHLAAVVSRSYEHLALKSYDKEKRQGRLQAAYGETVGHYADWAQVSAEEIRAANDLRSFALQPGRTVTIPLGNIDPELFNKQRISFHQQREASFFSEYAIAETKVVKLQRGQTMWTVAQSNGVPMWLIYRENPALLQHAAQVGMAVNVPVLRELPPATEK
ncbi:MAG TPA: LysM peptidoglycan-binding domain-containing protein, partial [bacterium]